MQRVDGSCALKDDKEVLVPFSAGDPFTQLDVVHYHEDIAMNRRRFSRNFDEYVSWERKMVLNDLYYLLVYVLDIDVMYCTETEDEVIFRPWLFNRCKEVESSPNFHVDIWAREHFKSTIITLGKTIQDILKNPEMAVCIFSYNVGIAEAFVRQIRSNLELPKLRRLFPDVIPADTTKGKYKTVDENGQEDTVKFNWSDQKFTLIRKTRRKEPTVSGYGLINAQPTGMHFDLLVYDDVVTPASVLTQSQSEKTTYQFKMSLNTGAGENVKVRIIGTYYALRDTYFDILNPTYKQDGKMGGSNYTLRKHPCLENGKPVLYSDRYIEMKKSSMIGYVFASQMMCDPQEQDGFRFLPEWIPARIEQKWMLDNKDRFNFYIICDPANTKTNRSDNTAMVVVATGPDKRYRIADIIRDKLLPSERVDALFTLVMKWENTRAKPTVFYESNSMSSDISNIQKEQAEEDYTFTVIPVTTKPKLREIAMGGAPLKANRIMALEPLFRERRVIFMEETVHRNWRGEEENMTQSFLTDEYETFPFSDHDDVLDAISRIADMETGIQMAFPDGDGTQFMDMAARKNSRWQWGRSVPNEYYNDKTQTGYQPF